MNDASVFQRLNSLADATRGRILRLLEAQELSVSELTAVVQLPQSTVSRHLRILSDEGWLTTRAAGPSRYYRLSSRLDDGAAGLWTVVREALAGSPEVAQDRERAREVVSRRRTRSQAFFASAAGQWDAVRSELFGPRPELRAMLALLDAAWVVGDLGCGTGRLAETVAPYVRRVVAVDESPDMLSAARDRLAGVKGVELRPGRLEALPLDDAELDVALLFLVLHYVPDPGAALEEAARVVRPGGRVLVVDMVEHGRAEYRDTMGHLWQGFAPARVEEWLAAAGFEAPAYHRLPVDEAARGPLLFSAVAERTR